ncbi:MAG: DUF3822 family protein [Bacteroidales bacterium]|jgi:hypothetical protein|nr:DUF3822 family protein [Bacteroidales bacterium]
MNAFLYDQAKSIRISTDGFSIFKKEGDKKNVKKEFFNVVLSMLPQHAAEFLNLTPEETLNVIVNTTVPILIPKPFFAEDHVREYLQIQFNISTQDHPFIDEIEDYYAVYFLTDEVMNNLKRLNTPFRPIHQATLLHNHWKAAENRPHSVAILCVNEKNFDIILLKNDKLQLINTYTYSENTDILYYLLNITKQFEMEMSEVHLQLIQNQSKETAILLRKFFPN